MAIVVASPHMFVDGGGDIYVGGGFGIGRGRGIPYANQRLTRKLINHEK